MKRHHPLANCEECPLFERDTFCPSSGPEKADLVLVGEAPGRNEVRQQMPFIGASGQLLNMILENYDYDREDVFITNTVLCQPEDNANPSKAAVKACSERLQGEIRSRTPQTIMALGNFASRSILSTQQGITTLRAGPPKVSPDYPDIKIIPTFHPAASLYNPGVFPDIITDFQKISRPNVKSNWSPPDIIVIDSGDDFRRNQDLFRGFDRPISVDIEVGIDKDIDVVHPEQYDLLCVGVGYERGKVFVIGENGLRLQIVRNALSRLITENRLIAHNGKFDTQGLWGIAPHARVWFDTMLASYCLDERRGIHSLEYNALERLGAPSWKHEIAHYLGDGKNYAAISRPVLYRYNAFDAHNTYLLWELFEEELDVELRMLHDHLVEAGNMLAHVEHNGVAVDVEYLSQLEEEYTILLDILRYELRQKALDDDYNPNSWQQVTRVLKDVYGRKVKDTQQDTLRTVQEIAARRGDMELYDFLALHLEFKKEAKSYGTYVKGTRKRLYEGRVHSTYMLHGTVNGRLASRNPNLQNVTRGSRLRRLFTTRSDTTVLGQGDYRQAELRVVCALARDSYLKSILDDDNRNIFEEVGREFYGPAFTRADKEQYIRTKAIVHGLNYGREAYSIAAEFGMSHTEAETYIQTFFDLIPGVVAWREDVKQQVHSGEDLISPFGNHRRFWLITKESRNSIEKEALAFYPQNIVSNLLLRAGIRMAREGMQDMLRIPVHDSWLFECEKDIKDDVAEHVSRVMEETAVEYFTDYVKFPVDLDFGQSWGDIA